MKFQHLTRHQQLVAAQRRSEQQTSSQQAQISDDEEDYLNAGVNIADNQANLYHDQQQQQQMQQQATANNQLDSSGFLIDKNKKLFPQKLWELIHNPSIQHCLRWSQDGQRVYLNRNEFEAYYLKTPNNQFHTQKAISFVRQMNMYGFRKVDDCYYENDNFRRDRQHLLRNMIRRHPNKGLFVGLDHHQLAAAAAAQQALQVNQQLQQLEQQHKHRTEQALRLNSYLNSHQFHQSALLAAAHHHQQQQQQQHHQLHHPNALSQHHSGANPFEHMSTQVAQAAADHLSQQQQQLLRQQQQPHQMNNLSNSNNLSNISNTNNQQQQQHQQQVAAPAQQQHQPKKSRLLSNFYAASNNTNNSNNNGVNGLASQDSMHSTSSVDTQCSSAAHSGSAGSPRPQSPSALHQRLAALAATAASSNNTNTTSTTNTGSIISAGKSATAPNSNTVNNSTRAAAMLADSLQRQLNGNGKFNNGAADLSTSNSQMATRQALHQSLVRSLLQLKQHPQDLLLASALQHQNPRSLLESLASLSSAGSGSVVDPASNSPTERTSTPPSSPPSPVNLNDDPLVVESLNRHQYLENNNLVLDLASKTPTNPLKRHHDVIGDYADIIEEEQEDDSSTMRPTPMLGDGDETEIEDDVEEVMRSENGPVHRAEMVEVADEVRPVNCQITNLPPDVAKKVRRFLENQMYQQQEQQKNGSAAAIKRELESPELQNDEDVEEEDGRLKRQKLSTDSITKALILEVCDRRGDQLDTTALQEAARYTECFLEMLLEDAALIARHSSSSLDADSKIDAKDEGGIDLDGDGVAAGNKLERCKQVVDTSSLSLALKLIPSKLIAAIQQQVSVK